MPLPTTAGRIIEIADAFLAELNTKLLEWGLMTPPVPALDEDGEPLPLVPLQAERKYTTEYELEDLKAVHVDVLIATLEEDIDDRKPHKYRLYGFNVVVQQQLTVEEVEPVEIDGVLQLAAETTADIMQQIDGLMKLTIAIFEHWPREGYIEGHRKVTVAESGIMPYSPDLQANTHYYGVVSFIFQESR